MAKQSFTAKVNSFKEWIRKRFKVPVGVKIAICVVPVFLTVLFYALRPLQGVMEWTVRYISSPVRYFLGVLSSIYPISLLELFGTLGGIFVIYYIIVAIRDAWRRRERWKILGRRFLWLITGILYLYSGFCWLWSSGYHARGFAERYGFAPDGVEITDLIAVTELFAEGANELSTALERDEDGNLVYSRGEMFAQSRGIYKNLSYEFPSLGRTAYPAKPMYMYSWLMTVTRYTGVYFALTGESMVNIQMHPAYMPATVSHEIAHQLGVFAEDEATFVGILACVTSGNPIFEYGGYMQGLNYLMNALAGADFEEFDRIHDSLTDEVKLDRNQNMMFWARATTSNTGIEFFDNALTTVMEKANEVVDAVYDDFLKSQGQELGRQSYGACVDLLVEYFGNKQ